MTPSIRIAAPIALTLFLSAAAAHAVVIRCEDATGFPGGTAALTVSLEHTEDEIVAGTQNDLNYDNAVFSADPLTDCAINPAIGPGSPANKELQSSSPPEADLRNIIVSLNTVNPIPSGDLYTCTLHVNSEAALGQYPIDNTNLVASNPDGVRLPVSGVTCAIVVGPTPTPTPRCRRDQDCPSGEVCVDGECVEATPTPTNTIATPTASVTRTATVTASATPRCRENSDCPDGEVCVDNMCVTPTPTRTGTVTSTPSATASATPLCRENNDCPSGEVCVDGTCVTATPSATPTAPPPTPKKKKGGGGGCSCEIDPGAGPRPADALAIVLPALVLLLRWRSRRAGR